MSAIRFAPNYNWASPNPAVYSHGGRQESNTSKYWWSSDPLSVERSVTLRNKDTPISSSPPISEPRQSHDDAEIIPPREIVQAIRQSFNNETEQHESVEVAITLVEPALYRGATIGDIKLFEEVLQDQEGIDRIGQLVTPQLNTVLHVAASFGHLEIVKLVHRHCPSLDMKKNFKHETALHCASRDGHLLVVNFLIKNFRGDIETGKVDVGDGLLRMKNVDGNTALHEATRNGHSHVAQLLIKEDQELAKFVNNVGESPFYLAAESGLSKLVRDLLDMEIDHMIQEKQEGKTALHAAIVQEHIDTIKILIEKKPDLMESRDTYGRCPLHYAAYSGCRQAISLLLPHNVSIARRKDQDGMSPLHLASINGHLNVFQELLKQCPDSRELLNSRSQNALHVASENRKENIVTFMLETPELGKLINERDVDGNTPLHLATKHGYAVIVSLLVRDKRIDLAVKNKEGHTAYEVAEMHASSQFSFQKILAAVALKSAGTPRRQRRLFFKRNVQDNVGDEKATMETFRDRISTLVLVATLIITITFASGFVIPGDHNGEKGDKGEEANQLLNTALHAYVISNTIAMYSSIVSAIMLIWAHLGDLNLLDFALRWSMLILAVALTMLAVAFAAGVYLVVHKFAWLATVVIVMSVVYLFCILALFIPLQAPIIPRYRWMGFISKFTLNFLLFATGLEPRGWLSD
ncbi:hypothetical protein ACHQM5_003108 [Ranunculus cassubicifolius]